NNPGAYSINESYWWGGSIGPQRDESDGVLPPGYNPPGSLGQTIPITQNMLEHPSTTIYFTDFLAESPAVPAIGFGAYSMPEVAWKTHSIAMKFIGVMLTFSPPIMDTIPFRHQSGVNVAFCDGHV